MPPKPARRVRTSARSLALDVLNQVFDRTPKPAELAFDQHPDLARLSERDRAFARLLYATTLRRLGSIDSALEPHLRQWPKDIALLNCLRLGVVQLHQLGTAPHAAIGETVDLAKQAAPFGAKMVNAVLRRVSEAPPPTADPTRDLPGWLLASWQSAYGAERAQRLAASLAEAPLDLTIPRDREAFADKLNGTPLGAVTLRLASHAPVNQLPGYDEGAWWVQDAAAAAIVPLLGDLRGKTVLDLCAAPGGKTAQLITAGAQTVAVEAVEARAARLRDNLARLDMTCSVLVEDARHLRPQPSDLVLLDAPCTATGTLRRHPDIAWARQPADVSRLAKLQAELLRAAATHLAIGGQLVYIVCSLQPEEGRNQIAAFLERNPGWRRLPFEPKALQGLSVSLSAAGDYQSFPDDAAEQGGMDGFYAARLIRTE